jgi:hypothetical protein
MLEVTQTKLHIPGEQRGNCMYAVLASLLHGDIESIPSFEGRDWVNKLNTWLRQYGLAFMCIHDNAEDFEDNGIQGMHHMLMGNTNRFAGVRHSVVARDGVLLFDVHPSRTGLTDGLVSGVFVSLEPWKVAETYTQNKEKQHE